MRDDRGVGGGEIGRYVLIGNPPVVQHNAVIEMRQLEYLADVALGAAGDQQAIVAAGHLQEGADDVVGSLVRPDLSERQCDETVGGQPQLGACRRPRGWHRVPVDVVRMVGDGARPGVTELPGERRAGARKVDEDVVHQ